VKRFRYSVSENEVSRFLEKNQCVREFLNRYEEGGITWSEKAVGLARFFQWLKVVKGLDLSPSEFLNLHLKKRAATTIQERQWALSLALEHSRDNPDLKGCAQQYKYSAFFLPVKIFCDVNEAPLTTTNGFFPKRGRRKYQEKSFTVDFVKQVLSLLNQRDRAVCMIQLQGGQGIKQVLEDINQQAGHIFEEIDAGKKRIRFDFQERKGNGFKYFTFIGEDAIQEIRKWRVIREQWLQELNKKSEYLFITNKGEPLTCKGFHNNFRLIMMRHGLYKVPYSVRRHGFRKFFEQEASPPERGISRSYVSFMMGHSKGTGQDHKLDVVGGVYDGTPTVYPDVVEKEYAKLEPYLNVYTGKTVHAEEKSKKELDDMKQQLSSLTSQVGQLTSMLGMIRGPMVPGKEAREAGEKAARLLEKEGYVIEK
jgi:integrase